MAGAVGRLCLGVFGSRPDPAARGYADALGIALQQANILRDLREDLLNGRVYVPSEDLDRFGVRLRLDATAGWPTGRLAGPADPVLGRAGRGLVRRGLRLIPLLDRRSAASAAAMSGIYRRCWTGSPPTRRSCTARRLSLPAGRRPDRGRGPGGGRP